jgi:hypothetical protein
MKGKSLAVHMAHLVGQFFGMPGLAVNVQGKFIGSLETGEMEDIQSRSSYHHKMHGPGQRSSTSTIPQGLSSTTKMNKIGTKLWTTGADDDDLTDITLPRLLALPTFVAEFINTQGGGCLPHKLRKFIKNRIDGGGHQYSHPTMATLT